MIIVWTLYCMMPLMPNGSQIMRVTSEDFMFIASPGEYKVVSKKHTDKITVVPRGACVYTQDIIPNKETDGKKTDK